MKKVLRNTKIFAIVLMITFTLATTAQSFSNEHPVEFKYIGNVNNHPRFLLNLNNLVADDFIVNITDQSGATIFNESLSGKLITRTYQLDSDDFDASVVNFHVYSKRTNSTIVYKVNNNQRFVNDVVINRK